MNVRPTFALASACCLILAAAAPVLRAQSTPPFSIDHYVIAAAGARSRASCFIVTGTAGQAAPGYSSGATFSVVSGYWATVAAGGRDEIFFDGFEGC